MAQQAARSIAANGFCGPTAHLLARACAWAHAAWQQQQQQQQQREGRARHAGQEHVSTQPLTAPCNTHNLARAQVKQVYKVGQNCPGFGRSLNGLFKQAITAGKRVRAETSISTGSVSVSSAAVELAQLKLPTHSWEDARTCIIGAGKMSTLLIKHLFSKGCRRVTLLNRSLPRAEVRPSLAPGSTALHPPVHVLAAQAASIHVHTCVPGARHMRADQHHDSDRSHSPPHATLTRPTLHSPAGVGSRVPRDGV